MVAEHGPCFAAFRRSANDLICIAFPKCMLSEKCAVSLLNMKNVIAFCWSDMNNGWDTTGCGESKELPICSLVLMLNELEAER